MLRKPWPRHPYPNSPMGFDIEWLKDWRGETGKTLVEAMDAHRRMMACAPPREHYSIELMWSDEDKGFVGRVPELPGCSFFGETRESALAEASYAIQGWLEACEEAGNAIPAPRINPQPHDWQPKSR